jgi:hypothetical protein
MKVITNKSDKNRGNKKKLTNYFVTPNSMKRIMYFSRKKVTTNKRDQNQRQQEKAY